MKVNNPNYLNGLTVSAEQINAAVEGGGAGLTPEQTAALGKIEGLENNAEVLDSLVSDGIPYAYNLNVGLKRWRQSLGKIDTVKDVIALGDSILEGAESTITPYKWWTTSWIARLRKKAQTEYGDAGLGIVPCYVPYLSNTVQTGFWSYSPSWSKQSWGFGFNGVFYKSNTANDTVTFTFTGESVSAILVKGAALSTSVDFAIDGVFISNVSCYSATTINAAEFVVATGLTNTQHTLTITNKVSTALFVIGAIVKNNVTDGIRFNMLGRSGIKSSEYIYTNNIYLETAIDFAANINPTGGNLFLVALGANDYQAQMSIASYKSNIQAIIDRAKPFGDVCLIGYGNRSDVISPTILFTDYMTALKELAILNDVAFVDINALWGGTYEYMNSTLGYIDGIVHPNVGGYMNIANIMKKIVLNERF